MLPITDESVGLIILITSCLTRNYLTFLFSSKWISLEVITIKTTRRNNNPPNHNKYGVKTGQTNFGIPALHPPEGSRRTHIQRSKDHTSATQRKRYARFFLEGSRWHRHLGIITTNSEYFVVATEVFLPPKNPGPAATIVAGVIGVPIDEMGQLHTTVTRIYRTYNNVDQAFKKMGIDAFENQYLNALSDEIVGYENCMSLELLTHLLTYYAMITPTELTQNYERLDTPYDPNQPIENFFQQIQDARAFAVARGKPYEDVMVVNVAFQLVFNTGLFPDACRAGQVWAIADNTWLQLKIDFAAAHQESRLTNQTAQQSGFHSANMMIEQGPGDIMQDTVDTIAQIATATASDRGTEATLTVINAKPSFQLKAAQAYIKMIKDDILALKAMIEAAWQVQPPAKSTNNNN
jgi:hypothetical protein